MPAGSYTVRLLFAETLFNGPNQRVFKVFINNQMRDGAVDVFKRVGKNRGLVLEYKKVPSAAKRITIGIISRVENPMLSGIVVEGKGAGELAMGGGCTMLSAEDLNLNGGFNHRAHAVAADGPIRVTDIKKAGVVSVLLDASLSHSHYSSPGPPLISGKIVAYKWSWTEITDQGEVVRTSRKQRLRVKFPLGVSFVTLEVADNTGDVATDMAMVTVTGTAMNGALCYAYDYGSQILNQVPIPVDASKGPKPDFGMNNSPIIFNSKADLKIPFVGNSFALRCSYFMVLPGRSTIRYSVKHNGPFKLFQGNKEIAKASGMKTTLSDKVTLPAGMHKFQIIYFRPRNIPVLLAPKLMAGDGTPLGMDVKIQHDVLDSVPVIHRLSSSESVPSGGGKVTVFGFGFIAGIVVRFGKVNATRKKLSSTSLQVTVPPGTGEVRLTVRTSKGVSNGILFTYTSANSLQQPVVFKHKVLTRTNGSKFIARRVATIIYGPDGRLYIGSTLARVSALTVNKDFVVTHECSRYITPNGKQGNRAILGMAFSPFSKDLKLYFTSSTIEWMEESPPLSFEDGWTNGKIHTMTFSKKYRADKLPTKNDFLCADKAQDLVTGLPVSGKDHAVNRLQFLPDGRMIVGIGGFTNGGISIPGKKQSATFNGLRDNLGGVASNPYSAALVSCPINKRTNIKYNQRTDPENARVVNGTGCELYATGLRNTFGMTLHTNGHLYASDNGPSLGKAPYSTNCNGGTKKQFAMSDKLFRVEELKFHGHPNLNRRECQHYPSSAVKPIMDDIQSSTDGVVEYRSNTFGGVLKGDLLLSKLATPKNGGRVSHVQLNMDGKIRPNGFVPEFYTESGVGVVEGPRGELVMGRVYRAEVLVVYPTYKTPSRTFLIGVHPKQGPSFGGARVLISGHRFGTNPRATFGGSYCTDVHVIDDESFTCLTPFAPKKGAKVQVRVEGATGLSPSYGSDYWYW